MQTSNSSSTNKSGANSRPKINPYFAIFVLTIATFMEVLDSTIATVSLPKISADLSVPPDSASWILGSYLIANAAILPISGWLATYFGRKRYFMTCIVFFIVSSFFCGISTNIESLVFFRIIQGLSGGGLATSEQAMIADIVPADKLGRAFSIYVFGLSFAPILGPTVGGWLTDSYSWHWIFFINVPIGILSFILVHFFVYESKNAEIQRNEKIRKGYKVDWVGILLFIVGIAAFELVLEQGPKEGWFESDFILLMSIVSFASIVIGITWEHYQENPVVDISMFKDLNFAASVFLIGSVSFVVFGSTFVIPFLSQNLLGYTAMQAGEIGILGALIVMIMTPIVGILIDKFDARIIIFVGLISSTLAVWNLASLNLNAGFYDLAYSRAFQNFSLSFLGASLNTIAYYNISADKNNSASALLNLARSLGASLGIALTSTLIAQKTQININNLANYSSNYNPNFIETLEKITRQLMSGGLTALEAGSASLGIFWETLIKQATMKSIVEIFQIYIVLYLILIPFVFVLKGKSAAKK